MRSVERLDTATKMTATDTVAVSGAVGDDLRIRATVPTIRELLNGGAALVVASHLGRPKGRVDESLRLAPIAERLGELLGTDVAALDEVVGEDVEAVCGHLEAEEVVLLENLRFEPGEEANEVAFAGQLSELADAYVDDAFGAAHREHASVAALPELHLASGRPAIGRARAHGVGWPPSRGRQYGGGRYVR